MNLTQNTNLEEPRDPALKRADKQADGRNPANAMLGLWSHSCGSNQALWCGHTLEEAAAAWLQHKDGEEEVHLTGWGRGTLATHDEMMWKYGKPTGTFACPICKADTPHQHTEQQIEWHRDTEEWKQKQMKKRWKDIEANIVTLTGAAKTQELEAQAPLLAMPPMNEDLLAILGTMCFQCIRPAQAMRLSGHEIQKKAEHEQAHVLHFLLEQYFKHGKNWMEESNKAFRAMAESSKAES